MKNKMLLLIVLIGSLAGVVYAQIVETNLTLFATYNNGDNRDGFRYQPLDLQITEGDFIQVYKNGAEVSNSTYVCPTGKDCRVGVTITGYTTDK